MKKKKKERETSERSRPLCGRLRAFHIYVKCVALLPSCEPNTKTHVIMIIVGTYYDCYYYYYHYRPTTYH